MRPTRPPTLRQQHAMPIVCKPMVSFVDREEAADRDVASKAGRRSLRAALSRFQTKHGADALISFLKIELERRGEERWRLDKLAPHPGKNGQTSILDAGR